MTNTELNGILKRIKEARKYCQKMLESNESTEEQREDAELIEEGIKDLVTDMCDYTCTVFDDNYKNATRLAMRESYTEVKDFQEECSRIEKLRKDNHDGLIISIKIIDNRCKTAGIEPIYGMLPEQYQKDTSGLMGSDNRKKPGVVQTRHAIADWAFDTVIGATVGIYMDLSELDYINNEQDYKVVSEDFKYKRGGKTGAKNSIMELTDPDL